jgi:hypothetical protein
MRKLIFGLLIASAAAAQSNAIVTIYTPGGYFKGSGRDALTLSTGKHTATASSGWLFDGDVELANLAPHQFVTFELPAGEHRLSAANAPKPKSVDPLVVVLEPGKHYFLQLTTTKSGVYIVQSFHSKLVDVSCEDARAEADTNKPVKVSRVNKAYRDKLVDGTYFPRCQ